MTMADAVKTVEQLCAENGIDAGQLAERSASCPASIPFSAHNCSTVLTASAMVIHRRVSDFGVDHRTAPGWLDHTLSVHRARVHYQTCDSRVSRVWVRKSAEMPETRVQ